MSAGRKYRRQAHHRKPTFLLPSIPDNAHPAVKDAIAIRNTATRTGRCPACLAGMEIDSPPRPGKVSHASVAHEQWCPAGNQRLGELVDRYGWPDAPVID